MNKKWITVQRYDSLIEIFEQISLIDSPEIQILIEDNIHLTNYLNLKLLLYRFPMKRFSFITSNSELKKLGEWLGIRFFQKNDDIEFEKEYAKNHILRHNFTFIEFYKDLSSYVSANFFQEDHSF